MRDHAPLHSQDEHTASSLVCHAGFALSMTAASVAGGILLVGNSFSLPSIHPDYPGVLSGANFAGVVLLIFGVPLGLVSKSPSTRAPCARLRTPSVLQEGASAPPCARVARALHPSSAVPCPG